MMIRPETVADAQAIRDLTTLAFASAPHASGTEAAIIDGLRKDGKLSVSLVAEDSGQIIGHLAFSPVRIGGQDCGWYGLGPVSVAPEAQGKGTGGHLIRDGLSQLRALPGAAGCVVLGDPAYYTRFGFAVNPALIFPDVPPEYFMALAFTGATPAGIVTYHPAFYAG